MPPITLNQIIALVILAIVATLGATTVTYRHMYNTTSEKLLILQHDVDKQAQEAKAKLAELTAERDAKQAIIDKQAKDQEIRDAQAKTEIASLHADLLSHPVRVRIAPAVQRSSSAAGDAIASAADRAADATPAYGVLPEENTRRLADALAEVETLSAAYNSCRARIMLDGILDGIESKTEP